ncbi:glycosyltransferase family protein [PVC group bacterium]|nr:glycosyltransferase family protein [PVC group bacterium]
MSIDFSMNPIAIIQARRSSNRLPDKIMCSIGADILIEKVIRRLSLSVKLKGIVLAIPEGQEDAALADVAAKHGIDVFRGSLENVLDRYYCAAKQVAANPIIRITGDCPLIAPEIVDNLINLFESGKYDYMSNHVTRSYPRGLDTEIFSFNALKKAHQNTTQQYEKEHVTPYIYEHPKQFKLHEIVAEPPLNRPHYRICVDTKEDLDVVRALYAHFDDSIEISVQQIVRFLDDHPDVCNINQTVRQKELGE